MNKLVYRAIVIATLSVAAVLAGSPVRAQSADAAFSATKDLSGKTFVLQGVGKKTVLFMRAFEVGYYQEKQNLRRDPLDNVAKRIEVRYFVDIPGQKLYLESCRPKVKADVIVENNS